MSIIDTSSLCKVYRYHSKPPGLRGSLASLLRRETHDRRAVDGVTFSIGAGELVGFLGPNGAGKTTTLKMLAGLLEPSGGSASVLGYTPARREAAYLRQISLVMGQKTMLWWDLPAIETLLLHKEIYQLSASAFHQTVGELADLLEVGDLLRVQVRKLSLGERMKMELLVALLHRPAVLFLDEPTIGLDVVAQQRIRDFLRDLNRAYGTTILLTSHYMDDIEALCSRVIVIDQGRLRYDGTLSALIEQARVHKVVTIIFAEPIDRATLAPLLSGAALRPNDDPRSISLAIPREQIADVTGQLLRLGGVIDVSIAEAPVEEVIRELFRSAAAQRSSR